jgi:DNA-binding FrmR family transcriptional regulator
MNTRRSKASHKKKAASGAFDPQAAVRRLQRIEGQIRGLQRMVTAERPCPEVVSQIASAQQALRGLARELMRHHLTDCEAAHLRRGSRRVTAAVYAKVLDSIYRHLR